MRLYDRLFTVPDPGADANVHAHLNPNSLEVCDARLEPSLSEAAEAVQFERLGYFRTDIVDHTAEKPMFNRILPLRDSWAKIEKQALADTQSALKQS